MQTRCLSAQDEEFVQRLAPVWAQQGGPAHGMDERAARSMLADVVKQLRSSVTPGLAGDLQRAIIRGAAAVEQLLTSLAAEERAGLLAAPLPCGQLPLHFACSYVRELCPAGLPALAAHLPCMPARMSGGSSVPGHWAGCPPCRLLSSHNQPLRCSPGQ